MVGEDQRQPAGIDARTGDTTFVKAGWRSQALCSCTWAGRRRLMRASAVVDALEHCAETGCTPADPLVLHG